MPGPDPVGTVLQVGATGELGGRIADRLLDRGVDLRVLVRDPADADRLRDLGADPVEGDLREPASLAAALEGVDRVLTTANAPGGREDDTVEAVDLDGNAALVEAAQAEGVDQLVYTSAWLADEDDPNPFFRAKARTERRLREADLPGTVLAPNIFMEAALPSIVLEPALATGQVTLVGEGRREHSWVSIEDVADLGARVLGAREACGQRLRLGGPEAVTWREIVDVAREVLDVEVDLTFVEPGEPVPGLTGFEAGLLAGTEEFDSPDTTDEVAEAFDLDRSRVGDVVRSWARDPGA